MKLENYAFIVMAPHYDASRDRAVIESPEFRTTVVGVESLEEACEAASELASNGIQLIELCGAFDKESARAIANAIDGVVPVGFITFPSEQAEEVRRLVGG
jgi:hypothetical protein